MHPNQTQSLMRILCALLAAILAICGAVFLRLMGVW